MRHHRPPHAAPQPVAADSVHVWRGFRAPVKSYADFARFLGNVFVPACALLQPNAGLRAYLPSMPAQEGKPASVPDQTALMFWATKQAYTDAFNTVAVRAYTNLHGDVYDTSRSSAQFPVPFAGQVAPEQPYHLFDAPADWMLGTVRHLVGARPTAQPAAEFLDAVAAWAAGYQSAQPGGVDAALLCAGDDYVVFWEHRPGEDDGDRSSLAGLAALVTPYLDRTAEPLAPEGLWENWAGWDLVVHDCANVQLRRPEPSHANGEHP